MRHLLQLVNIALQKEPKQDKTLVEEPNPLLWECLAKLVHETGFTSRKIALLSCVAKAGRLRRSRVAYNQGKRI
jgi:hypothetical protein